MSTQEEIITAIQTAADAAEDSGIKIAFGTPGGRALNIIGQVKPTGQAWLSPPSTWSVIIQGIADWLDAGVTKSKMNELIGAYNQLREDYNNGIVPTSALEVTPLP